MQCRKIQYRSLKSKYNYTIRIIEIKKYIHIESKNTIIHTYFASRLVLYVNSSHNVSKSMAFVSGGVQKHFNSQHFDRHSDSSSCSYQT